MKTTTDSYHYENKEHGIGLDFAFNKDKTEFQKKEIFVGMLKKATADLEAELAANKN